MSKKIGQLINERVKAQKMSVTDFSAAIGVERSNAYHIFSRDSIDTELLKKIGQVLDYDFFQDLLLPETRREIIIRSAVSNKVFIELELSDDEIQKLRLKDKVVKIINL